MQVSKQASKGHLIVGIVLVLLSLAALIATFITHKNLFAFLIFFFGVWGGVELGRYLEFSLQQGEMEA
jgi:hypothetical protein